MLHFISPYSAPQGTTLSCASENQMKQRTSNVFYANVAWNVFFGVLTILMTYWVIRNKLRKHRSVFTKSANILLQWIMVKGMFHAVIYGAIQLSSLAKSLLNSHDPCSIMFDEFECWPLYTLDILARLMISFDYNLLTIDGALSSFFVGWKPSKSRANILHAVSTLKFGVFPMKMTKTTIIMTGTVLAILNQLSISIVCAVVTCLIMTSDGPTTNILANCLARQGRDLGELTRQLLVYGGSYTLCFALTTITWIGDYCKSKKGATNIHQIFENEMRHRASRFLFFATLIEMVVMSAYPAGVIILIKTLSLWDPVEVGNYVLWTYQFNVSTCILPGLIWMFVNDTIRKRREHKERVMSENKVTTTQAAQDDYFTKLASDWDDKLKMKEAKAAQHALQSGGRHSRVAPEKTTVEA